MIILGIESSCDDLSMAVVQDGKVRANVTASQVAAHRPFGGVVPEIASRQHLEALEGTLEVCLEEAGVTLNDLQGIAATYAPGLVGSLLVGLNFAKALAFGLKIPFRGIHHIEGHLWSAFLEHKPHFPFLGLVVSGGHTHLYWVEGLGKYQAIGQTVDDAAGEAFDKVAKMMGLTYPGGPAIDRLSETGDPEAFPFSLPRVKANLLNTSFSGMKTAAVEHIANLRRENSSGLGEVDQKNLAASFQGAVVRALTKMVSRALEGRKAEQLVVAGGVACNRALRSALQELAESHHLPLVLPSPRYCTDNGAMIALAGEMYLERGDSSLLSLNAKAREPLGLGEKDTDAVAG